MVLNITAASIIVLTFFIDGEQAGLVIPPSVDCEEFVQEHIDKTFEGFEGLTWNYSCDEYERVE
jgi:hypothetical protein